MRPLSRTHHSSEVLRARTIEVIDPVGNVRLRVGVAADGTAGVRLYDYSGTRRLELAVRPEGPAVTVFDGRGVERHMIEASPGLEPSRDDEARPGLNICGEAVRELLPAEERYTTMAPGEAIAFRCCSGFCGAMVQSLLNCPSGDPRTGVEPQLIENVLNMGVHCSLGYRKRRANLTVG